MLFLPCGLQQLYKSLYFVFVLPRSAYSTQKELKMGFGVLTLATEADYRKAIGLALSARISNPNVPLAVACEENARPFLSPYFDAVIVQDASLRRFEHKLYLDKYSPFDETFFFDSDVLIFRPLADVLDRWRTQPYSACGTYASTGVSPFGLNVENVLKIIGRKELVQIDGAGHAYFRKPACDPVFELAREVMHNYSRYAGTISLADEDVMNIVMSIQGLSPMPHAEFWSRHCSAVPGSVEMNATDGHCSFRSVDTGQIEHPYMMHFAAREAPFVYLKQLRTLFEKFNVRTNGLTVIAFQDFYTRELKWRFKRAVRAQLSRFFNFPSVPTESNYQRRLAKNVKQ
jgi:hypothetical protein